jgi:hypothetical protein
VFLWWLPAAALAIAAIAIALYAVWPTPGTPRVPVIGLVDEATDVQMLTNADYISDVIKAGDGNIAAGLAIKTVRINRVASDRPIDQVIASNPKATALRPLGSEVVLTVSLCPLSPPLSSGAPSPPPPRTSSRSRSSCLI